MSWGRFYQIPDSARNALSRVDSKSEWYDELGKLKLENAAQLDAEEAIQYGWRRALVLHPTALGRLFSGDLRARPDESDDPDVVFLGAELVGAISSSLNEVGREDFLHLLRRDGFDSTAEIWLLEPLKAFFGEAASRNNAVIVLWGG